LSELNLIGSYLSVMPDEGLKHYWVDFCCLFAVGSFKIS